MRQGTFGADSAGAFPLYGRSEDVLSLCKSNDSSLLVTGTPPPTHPTHTPSHPTLHPFCYPPPTPHPFKQPTSTTVHCSLTSHHYSLPPLAPPFTSSLYSPLFPFIPPPYTLPPPLPPCTSSLYPLPNSSPPGLHSGQLQLRTYPSKALGAPCRPYHGHSAGGVSKVDLAPPFPSSASFSTSFPRYFPFVIFYVVSRYFIYQMDVLTSRRPYCTLPYFTFYQPPTLPFINPSFTLPYLLLTLLLLLLLFLTRWPFLWATSTFCPWAETTA